MHVKLWFGFLGKAKGRKHLEIITIYHLVPSDWILIGPTFRLHPVSFILNILAVMMWYLLKSQRFLQFVLGILKNWVGVLMQRGKTQYCAKVLCYPYFLISRRQTSLLFLKWNWTIVLQTFQRNFNVCIFCCFQSSPRICILFIRMFVLLFVCFF